MFECHFNVEKQSMPSKKKSMLTVCFDRKQSAESLEFAY